MIKASEDPLTRWFFVHSGQRVGPVDESEVVRRIRRGEIANVTLVWKKGMEHWKPAGETELLRHFPTDVPPPVPIETKIGDGGRAASEEQNLHLLWQCWTVLLLISTGLAVVGSFAPGALLMSILPGIGATVIWCLMLHKFWTVIQEGEARTTPGKAVGFMFIPFFNFYWFFVGVLGLAQDMNNYCRKHSIEASPIDVSLTKVLCICYCAGILGAIPVIGALYFAAFGVLSFLVWKQVKESCTAILTTRPQSPA